MSNDDISSAAALLGKKGGQAKSEAKRKACIENGKRGGRPVATGAKAKKSTAKKQAIL
tara:strand:- start:1227 stop:1400 length:174 start_codon:yes stop_codon:yes gene_type:complete